MLILLNLDNLDNLSGNALCLLFMSAVNVVISIYLLVCYYLEYGFNLREILSSPLEMFKAYVRIQSAYSKKYFMLGLGFFVFLSVIFSGSFLPGLLIYFTVLLNLVFGKV